ncbi:AbrB family transcriptional regulator [Afifella pfennigii]|uniref:AbrB family transcriptional regulator n=1 Tax=Afifella pfennigii TaxID=209897 RepID=UPI0006906C31|nr:AbrB family transcriptional regulator [Afifella pfennigii]
MAIDKRRPAGADWKRALRVLLTLLISAAGGLLFTLLGMPAGWIAGGMLAVAAVSLAGFESDVPGPLRNLVYLLLGVIAGTGVTPETLNEMATWPLSFFILAVTVTLVSLGGYLWLSRGYGWDRQSALFASLPGALSFVLAAAETTTADLRRVAIAQSLRLIILLEALPAAVWLAGIDSGAQAGAREAVIHADEIGLLFAAGAAGGLLLHVLRVPGGLMLGGLAVAAALSISGTITTGIPAAILVPSLIGLGAVAGCRLRPEDRRQLPRVLGAATGAFAVAVVISAAGAGLVSYLLDVPLLQSFMAFAPGALEVLTVLAFTLNVDPAYVAAHHVVRFVALALMVPVLARWMMRSA